MVTQLLARFGKRRIFMACFIVPAAEAVVTKVVEKVAEKNEKTQEGSEKFHVPFSRKLRWLSNMLLGGSFLLLFEHIWHGEVQPFFPFLTAMSDAEATHEMLHEMATVGVTMAVFITLVWGVICVVTSVLEKKANAEAVAEQ